MRMPFEHKPQRGIVTKQVQISVRLVACIGLFLSSSVWFAAQGTARSPQSEGAATGAIAGTVYDAQSGQVLRGAVIEVVDSKLMATTDLDGRYTVKLPPGTYELKVLRKGYYVQPIQEVMVAARQVVYLDPVLVVRSVLSERVVVQAETPGSASVKAIMVERNAAQAVTDIVSAEDIGRNPDSDAAGVLERVTGISVVQDKYVFVRGLGERYSNTMLNGAVLPSTEPERKDVPFDLFNASLINKISTIKTFTPDQPGDFTGGLVKIDTIEFPAEATMKYSAGAGYNTNITTRSFLTYPGSHLDWLGSGYEHRRLPRSFPPVNVTVKNAITGSGFTPQELQQFGRQLRNEWEPRTRRAAPDFSQSFMGSGPSKTWGRSLQRPTPGTFRA